MSEPHRTVFTEPASRACECAPSEGKQSQLGRSLAHRDRCECSDFYVSFRGIAEANRQALLAACVAIDPQPTSRGRVVRPRRSIVPDGCSAIDGDRRSLDVAGTLRAQEQSERRDILDLAEAADAAFGQRGGAQLLDRHTGRLRSLR